MTVYYIAVRRVNLRLDAGVPYRISYEYIMKDGICAIPIINDISNTHNSVVC